MSTKIVAVLLSVVFFAAASLRAKVQPTSQRDALEGLVGDWTLSVFVIGGGYFSFRNCFNVSVAPPRERAVSVAASCGEVGDYSFRLKQGSETKTYLLSVKSKYGISVEDFPLAYDGQGWRGERDQLVDGEHDAVTATVLPEAPQNMSGWKIEVLPTAAVKLGPKEIKKPYFSAQLSRSK